MTAIKDEPHTGDDELLDAISAAYVALDMAIDEDDDQYGPDARETVSAVMADLERAQTLRVAELVKARPLRPGDLSAQPCGCDPGCKPRPFVCEQHQ